MSGVASLVRFFQATDALMERVEPTWWGAVVTDSRFPVIWDVNYARVDESQPDLSLDEVEASLFPAIRASGARHVHLVVFRPEGTSRLLLEAERRGHKVSWEQAMRHSTPGPAVAAARIPVMEVDPGDDSVWTAQRHAYREFDVDDAETADQLLGLAREVLTPAGRRWFAVREGPLFAGLASLQVRDGVGYIDDVVTFPEFRRRGIASALVARAVDEARATGVEEVFLVAERPNAVRLYERLGFVSVGQVASSLAAAPGAL